MDKIIKQIYAGFDRFSADTIGIDSPGYIHIRDKCYEAHEAFRPKLPLELVDEFDKLMEYDLAILAAGQEDGFIDGFRLGALLMMDIFS